MLTCRNLFLLIAISILYGCKEKGKSQNKPQNTAPVETQSPHTKYQPAFKEQTRAPGTQTQTELQVNILAESIGRPWGITHLPDGRLLITDKTGFMQIFETDGVLITKITGFPKVDSQGQGGMLDVAIDPDFENNRFLYWSFSEPYKDGNLTSVGKGRLAEDEKKIENPKVIFRAEPAYDGNLHYGSRLIFDAEGFLIFSTGERSDRETRSQAQDLNSGLGKIFRINIQTAKSQTSTTSTPISQIFSYGHRNVQGLALHPKTGELWSSEFGPKGGDELNLVKEGKNYGWPTITYGMEYSGEILGKGLTQKQGMEQPVYYWDPSVSPSGITFYEGEITEWKNNLFLACLSGQHIIRLTMDKTRVIGEERLLTDEGERFRDIHQGKDGKLYTITDSGKIYSIGKRK